MMADQLRQPILWNCAHVQLPIPQHALLNSSPNAMLTSDIAEFTWG